MFLGVFWRVIKGLQKTSLFVVLISQKSKDQTAGPVFCSLGPVWSQSFSSLVTRPSDTNCMVGFDVPIMAFKSDAKNTHCLCPLAKEWQSKQVVKINGSYSGVQMYCTATMWCNHVAINFDLMGLVLKWLVFQACIHCIIVDRYVWDMYHVY